MPFKPDILGRQAAPFSISIRVFGLAHRGMVFACGREKTLRIQIDFEKLASPKYAISAILPAGSHHG
jgi:hypothetical protein